MPIGIGASISAICAPVNTASTPSIASAALTSMERMRPCATSLRLNARCCMPDDLDVVDVRAAALDQARVFATP